MTRLLFQGDFAPAVVLALAAGVAGAAAWFYRRETATLAGPLRWLLPLLRGGAILLTLLMLAGPVLQHRTTVGSIARVDVFVDVSDSMRASDSSPETLGPLGNSHEDALGGNQGDAGGDTQAEGAAPGAAATRLQRAARLLLGGEGGDGEGGDRGPLASLRETHHVQLHAIAGDQMRLLWDSLTDQPLPQRLTDAAEDATGAGADSGRTDLAGPIAAVVQTAEDAAAPANSAPRRAVVLLSDGQHNSGPSPQTLAQRLGDARIPLHVIGIGSADEPRDVAILDVEAPPSVAANGRASGWITIKDLADPGEPLRLRILLGDQTLWQQELTSEQRLVRRVAFDFSVAPWVQQLHREVAGEIERTRVTLPLRAVIDPVPGQYDAGNNQLPFRLAANLRQRRLLIVDSRPRWETRYLRNLFDRDPSWQVETVLAWPQAPGGSAAPRRGEGAFPPDASSMASFDAVIWGDVGSESFSDEQLKRVREFTAQGGALVLIDGNRNRLLSLRDSPLGSLFPVRLSSGPLLTGAGPLVPSPVGAAQAALRLSGAEGQAAGGVPAGGTRGEANLRLWQQLPPPTTLRAARPLPGAEVWLETAPSDEQTNGGQASSPVLVTRLFGGGQVVYLATDQTWRWRYRVADRYHGRFWNQLLEAIMQPPFEVRDQYVALASGAPQYTAGQRAAIRVRLRDGEGQSVGDAVVEAVLQSGDGQSQTVLLAPSDADRGVYEGRTPPLVAGEYEVSVRSAGYRASEAVKTTLLVVPPPDREAAQLALDRDLLQAMADASGGLYADEAEAERVWQAIEPLSQGRVELRRVHLAQSYYWFFAVMGLLSAEWWCRKRAGLV